MRYCTSPQDERPLQRILDHMKKGDKLKLKKGVYRLSAPLIIRKNIKIYGAGKTPNDVRLEFQRKDGTPACDGIVLESGLSEILRLTIANAQAGIRVRTKAKKIVFVIKDGKRKKRKKVTEVRKCRIENAQTGVWCERKCRVEFTRCFIANSLDFSIYVEEKARPRFLRCAAAQCRGSYLEGHSKHKAKFKRCCVFRNKKLSLSAYDCERMVQCLFSENTDEGRLDSRIPCYITEGWKEELRFKESDWPFQELIERYCGRTLALILRKHGEDVGGKALDLADRLGLDVDREFLREAAMLHDIGVFMTYRPEIGCEGKFPYELHGFLGAEILRKEGLHRHADAAERHVGTGLTLDFIQENYPDLPQRDMCPRTLEEELICFADIFFSKSKLGSEKSMEKARKKVEKSEHASLEQFDEWCEKFKC